ncbi:MAG: acetyl/propionyl/methylcrotonyl-CoA carboxylase subunit alpha [Hyphomicrobiales bacterium]|nr:acetyl/propionyl/methylcrotonyl-CoA carboxylase subunit alpha [Hyphomicrobiales bacterium]MCP5373900.1 acetyl/propionyl/methylcrotonyl-CoA carboxylase subunit alpha [Hyphomicrobiales bacterium]
MFDKILIANRGEIACRVMRTARRLGVQTVAVYSDADAQAMHVAMADEARHIGPAPAAESYLVAQRILEAAQASGAQAVHPGYGFLSENAHFARACAAAGIAFIGPPVPAIEAMGSKSAAKALMADAGVPLVPGYHGEDQSLDALAAAAEATGYPVLIKAALGGGGKGMRVVEKAADLEAAIAAAQRESASAFGDSRLLIERYLTRPRHVEIQVFADTQGNAIHLFERDCSIQRRHQKVVEEAPAPGLAPALRRRMGEAAVAAARAIGYVGAGTVEFLLDEDESFYFMEMNTRLQVEHPVTEMVTGQDLVEWQLRVAAGEPLPCGQDDLVLNGHAIEVRVYAENEDFMPSTGRLRHLRPPAEDAHVRVDTGVRQGDEVTIHYDPMIAKLIVWDRNRAGAIRRLRGALADYQIVGPASNLDFLANVAAHPAFAAGDLDTRFIDRHRGDLVPQRPPAGDRVLALAALDVLLRRAREAAVGARASNDPFAPWHQTSGWRLNDDNHHEIRFQDGGEPVVVTVHYRPRGFVFELPGGAMAVDGEIDGAGDLHADLDGARLTATVVRHGDDLAIMCDGRSHRVTLFDPAAHAGDQDLATGRLTAPMPGKVIAVRAAAGDRVAAGAPLLVLEAMKMEHTIAAPADGTVTAIHYAVGDQVEEGVELAEFEAE